MEKTELLPCPFCGCKQMKIIESDGVVRMPEPEYRQVICCQCGALSDLCETEEEAIKAWNTRTPSEPVTGEGKEALSRPFKDFLAWWVDDDCALTVQEGNTVGEVLEKWIPFRCRCGSNRITIHKGTAPSMWKGPYFQVWCKDCGIFTGIHRTKLEAIHKWNMMILEHPPEDLPYFVSPIPVRDAQKGEGK